MVDLVRRLESTEREVERLRECVQLLEVGWQRHLEQREEARAAARQVVREVLAREPYHPCAPDWLRTWWWLEEKE